LYSELLKHNNSFRFLIKEGDSCPRKHENSGSGDEGSKFVPEEPKFIYDYERSIKTGIGKASLPLITCMLQYL
jgi:hypothetical protein